MITTNITKRLALWALLVAALTMIPFLGNWPWTGSDYVFAVVMLFGSALAYEFISRKFGTSAYRYAVALGVGGVLLLTWINLAVGIIDGEDNPANAMYFLIPLIAFAGILISRLKPFGMARTLYTMATVQILIPVVAYVVFRPEITSSEQAAGTAAIFVLNAFFATLFAGSGILFKRAGTDSLN